jgi:hypothetical protein
MSRYGTEVQGSDSETDAACSDMSDEELMMFAS